MEIEKKVEIFNSDKNLPTYKIVYNNCYHGGFRYAPEMIAALREKFGVEVEALIKKDFRGNEFISLPSDIPRHDPKLITFMEEYVRLETQFNSEEEFCAGWSFRIIETDSRFYKIIEEDYNERVYLEDEMVESPNTAKE